jgi:hypothetical protein
MNMHLAAIFFSADENAIVLFIDRPLRNKGHNVARAYYMYDIHICILYAMQRYIHIIQ